MNYKQELIRIAKNVMALLDFVTYEKQPDGKWHKTNYKTKDFNGRQEVLLRQRRFRDGITGMSYIPYDAGTVLEDRNVKQRAEAIYMDNGKSFIREAAKSLSVFEKNQKNIALKTLKMNNPMLGVMGGMNKEEAKKFLKSIGYTDQEIKKLEK